MNPTAWNGALESREAPSSGVGVAESDGIAPDADGGAVGSGEEASVSAEGARVPAEGALVSPERVVEAGAAVV
jgi:hypothetical protein